MQKEYWSGLEPITDPEQIVPLKTKRGQTVEDITIGFSAVPADVTYRIRFFRESTPDVPEVTITMNQRASFRYVTTPDMVITLAPGERLLWHVTEVHGWMAQDAPPPKPDVWTKGLDIQTKRVIVNQGVYTNTQQVMH